ncbi:MAG: hypothetical protein ACKO6L_05190, partial [Flavobacteriales bacterium]
MTSCIRIFFVTLLLMGCIGLDAQSTASLGSSTTLEWNDWSEQPAHRSAYTATWANGRGGVRMQSSSIPIHYKNGAEWEKIDWTPQPTSEGYAALQQPFPVSIHHDGSSHISLNAHAGISWKCVRSFGFDASSDAPWQQLNALEFNRMITLATTERVSFQNNALKSNYRVASWSVMNHVVDRHAMAWDFLLPPGARFKRNEMHGFERDQMWYGELLIEDAQGEVIST